MLPATGLARMPSDLDAHNLLIDALPVADRARIVASSERHKLALGTVLHEPGRPSDTCYFPVDCIGSLLYELSDGSTAEVAIVGHEGMVGVPTYMGDGRSPHRGVIQVAGHALLIKASELRAIARARPRVQRMLLGYSQALSIQMAQTAVCNRHHSVAQQLCRWLLMSVDRLPQDQLTMTQDLIAHMLGVRRAGVSEVASKLQREGLICYQRGHIEVLDREGLEACSCECYQLVVDEYRRLLKAAPSG
mgnify:CR=1 FL=1